MPSGDAAIDNSRNDSETFVEMGGDNDSGHEESSKAQHGDTSAEGFDQPPENVRKAGTTERPAFSNCA